MELTGEHLIQLGIDECIDSIEFKPGGCTIGDTEANEWEYNFDDETLIGPETYTEVRSIHFAVDIIREYTDNN